MLRGTTPPCVVASSGRTQCLNNRPHRVGGGYRASGHGARLARGTVRLLPEEAERELLSAVVAADRQTLAGRSHEDRPAAAGKLAVVCGGHKAQENDAQRRGAVGALGPETKSLSRSRSVSNLFGTSDLISFDDLEVRSHPRRTTSLPCPSSNPPS